MKSLITLPLILSSLFSLTSATAHGKCTDLTIPITATAENVVWAFPELPNAYAVATFFNDATQWSANTSALVKGKKNVTGTFHISAKYCTPLQPSKKSSTLQILTHGLGFDKSYWDFTLIAGNYSYTSYALSQGYSTLTYDRIGVGLSTPQKLDPYTTLQAPLQLAILIELTKAIRTGSIHAIPAPQKTIHIGHSFGSALTNALAAVAPTLTDAIVMQSFSHNASFAPLFLANDGHVAANNVPERFTGYSTGAVTWSNQFSNQYIFFDYPYFDPKVLAAAEAGKWPFAIGELLTQGGLPFLSKGFQGPVLFLAAAHDLIFCGFDCTGILDGPYAVTPHLFPATKAFKVYIQPNVGHGMNLHFNSTGAYKVANDFFGAHGL
jgi:pimeloyl-ACP methyl ester carboxylesterase